MGAPDPDPPVPPPATEDLLRRARFLQRVGGRLARVGGWTLELDDLRFEASEELLEVLAPYGGVATLEDGLAQVAEPYRSQVASAFERCIEHGTSFDLEVPRLGPDGERWVRIVAELELDDDGRPRRVVGAIQDVTERREATERARTLAQRLEAMFDSITDGFFAIDREWRISYVNRRAEEMMQRPRASAVGRVLWDEFPIRSTGLGAAFARTMDDGQVEVVEDFRFEPLDMWLTVRAYPSPTGISVLIQDVSAQHRAFEELREREARLAEQAALLDEARDAIVVRDLEHRIRFWNRGAQAVFGWSADEAVGRSMGELVVIDPAVFEVAWEHLLEEGHWQGEVTTTARSGRSIVVDYRKTLVRDAAGAPTAVLGIMTDITERKAVEAQLLRAQRVHGIGAMASGLAHNLNNALTPIAMLSELLASGEPDERRREHFETILASAERATDMVRQMLSYAGAEDGRRVAVDADTLLRDAARIAEATFLGLVHVVREDARGLAPVSGDPTQLHQVLINLCMNARDAMPAGGTLRLAADEVLVDERTAARNGGTPGRYVRLRVDDTGHGMTPEVLDHVFEPFFTTKEPGHGTGLGLSTSAGIVRNHGGFFRVESEPGVGTSFEVHLPAHGGVAPTVEPGAPKAATASGDGRGVLVVEDDESLREVVRQVLVGAGFRTFEAADGADAIATLPGLGDDCHAIVTDMMMPGLSGEETIAALRRLRPDLPIIATSGLPANGEIATALGVARFLAKPFTIDVLLRTLHEVLRGR